MRLDKTAQSWGVAIALVLTITGRCEGQPPNPTDLTLEEARFVSGQEVPPKTVALRPSAAIPRSSAVPVGNGIDLAGLRDLAIAQSPKLSVRRAAVGESRMSALATGLFPNPVVRGGGKNASGGGSDLVLEINQELPLNGSRKLDRQAATLLHSAERAALEREIQVVLSEIENAYIEVLAANGLVAVDRRGLEVAGDSRKLVSDNYEAGLASSLPLSLAQSEEANAKKTLLISENRLRVTRNRLAGQLALDEISLPPVIGDLHQTLLPAGMEGGESIERPDLQASSLQVRAARTATESARKKMLPNPTFGYEREEGDDTENFFTLGMEIPLFNSGRPKVRESVATQQVASERKSALAQAIRTEVEVGAARLNSARDAVSIYENEIHPSNLKSLEAAKSAFQSGTTDLSLLLQTQSSLVENERDYIRALKELRDAEIAYKLAVGDRKESVQ